MIFKHEITKEQALFAISNEEFSSEVLNSKSKVVVVMTQNWCPQWIYMRSWLYSQVLNCDLDIYELIYNKVAYFNEFMSHKERIWHNYDVPYLRYYSNGTLFKESNYTNQKNFVDIINSL